MSGGKFHVHGPHDHAVEHAAHGEHGDESGGKLTQWVAIFTAILATIGAIVSYQGGHTQNEALYFKNEAVLKKADAANQWAFYQGKSTKQNLAELSESIAITPELKAKYAADVARYKVEKEAIKKDAEKLEALSLEADKKSASALNPHDKLAQAMTFIQIAISMAAICIITRRRWMFGLAGVAATAGIVFWVLAFFSHGV
jgi:Domain of unknown function (DUF4337)